MIIEGPAQERLLSVEPTRSLMEIREVSPT